MPAEPPRLLDQVRETLRRKHDAIHTEAVYVSWIRRSILFHGKCHPRDLGVPEVEAFLSDFAIQQHVAALAQN